MTLKEKLRQFAEYKEYSLSKFSSKIGKSNKFLAVNGSIHSDLLPLIRKKFPDLNMNWLLFDEGDMIITDSFVVENSNTSKNISAQKLEERVEVIEEFLRIDKKFDDYLDKIKKEK